MKRYAWVDRRGRLLEGSRKGRRILRVYRVVLKDGTHRYCTCDGKWWYPVEEGDPPIRNRNVKSATDVTARYLQEGEAW